jgi:hypothetical protein
MNSKSAGKLSSGSVPSVACQEDNYIRLISPLRRPEFYAARRINLPIPLQIVAFGKGKELRQFAPMFKGKPIELAGLFQQASDRGFILLDMAVENPWTVVFHEYAHQLMNGNLQGEFDPWFQEGFAEYFSRIEVDNRESRVGKIPDDEYKIVQQVGMMKIADLFKVRQNSETYDKSGDHWSSLVYLSPI